MYQKLASTILFLAFFQTGTCFGWDYDEMAANLPCEPDCTLEQELFYSELLSELQTEDLIANGYEADIRPGFYLEEDYFTNLSADELYRKLARVARQIPNFPNEALRKMVNAYTYNPNHFTNRRYLVLIDFRKPSTAERMFVFDLSRDTVSSHFTSHGVNSGGLNATHFSNTPGSRQSTLGFLRTGVTYIGANGRSLNLHGLENHNSNAFSRRIVIHKADYVSRDYIRRHGMLGRSWGCPAVKNKEHYLVDQLANGVLVYKHH